MNISYLSIASFTIAVKWYSPLFPRLCSYFMKDFSAVYNDFTLPRKPRKVDFTIHIKDQRMLQVIKLPKKDLHTVHFYTNQTDKELTTFYHISIYQFQVIIRIITNILLSKKTSFMLHASASKKNNKIYIFLAKSGGGKSTITKLLHPNFTPYADDTLIIVKEANNYQAYQTPFIEKEDLIKKASNGYPVQGIYFLKKSLTTDLKTLSNNSLLIKKLYQSMWFHSDSPQENFSKIAQFMEAHFSYFQLSFPKKSNEVFALLSDSQK